MDPDQHLLTTREAARRLGLAAGTLQNWRVKGRGPAFVRAGRRILYQAEDLRRWAAARRIEPERQAAGQPTGDLRAIEAELEDLGRQIQACGSFEACPYPLLHRYAVLWKQWEVQKRERRG